MGGEPRFLSVEQILEIHEDLLRRYGGSSLPGHRGTEEGVAAVVGAIASSYYEDVFELAAAYAVYIVMGHVFGDGNKRTGSAAALAFLGVQGIDIDCGRRDLLDLMLDIQRRAESSPRATASDLVAMVAGWLRKHAR